MMPPKDTPHGHYVIVNILPDGEEEKFTFFTEGTGSWEKAGAEGRTCCSL